MTTTTPRSDKATATSTEERYSKLYMPVIRSALSDRAFRLYAEIKLHAWDSSGARCTAAQTTLAKNLGWSVDKVQRAAAELESTGLLTKFSKRGKPNVYSLTHRELAVTPTAKQRRVPTAKQRYEVNEVEANEESGSSRANDPVASPSTPSLVSAAAASSQKDTNSFEGETLKLVQLVRERPGATTRAKPHHEQQLTALIVSTAARSTTGAWSGR
jgi:hypothetical protein